MTVKVGSENVSENASVDERNPPHHWSKNGRQNWPLQVFIYVNDWIGFTEAQKASWLRFAQTGEVISTLLYDNGDDECQWTVTKALPGGNQVVASKVFRIRGLANVFQTVPKEP